ncbi:WhiB family transcriptional regulator [Rhodococcus aetherivorans]
MHAACRSLGDYYFFPPDDERDHDRNRRERAAKEICATCPVLAPCRNLAHDTDVPYGVWGGLSESERRLEKRRETTDQACYSRPDPSKPHLDGRGARSVSSPIAADSPGSH